LCGCQGTGKLSAPWGECLPWSGHAAGFARKSGFTPFVFDPAKDILRIPGGSNRRYPNPPRQSIRQRYDHDIQAFPRPFHEIRGPGTRGETHPFPCGKHEKPAITFPQGEKLLRLAFGRAGRMKFPRTYLPAPGRVRFSNREIENTINTTLASRSEFDEPEKY